MEKKNYEICERVKKKKLSRPQYFYNKSHVINYYLFKKICDKLIVAMALPKLGKKNQVQLTHCKLKYNILILKWCKQKQKKKKVLRTQVQYSYSEVLWTKTKKST